MSYPADDTLLTIDAPPAGDDDSARVTGLGLDVVFPVLHGPYGEDGTVQGLLELANVPYVGAGVLASAVGMDKAFMKIAFAARGLPVAPYRVAAAARVARPPAGPRAGHRGRRWASRCSSSRPTSAPASASRRPRPRRISCAAIDLAFQFDRKVVVEAAVPAAREIEVGVLGNDAPEASVAGEIIPSREFYDYEAKYLDEGSVPVIPADARRGHRRAVRRLAVEAFQAVDCSGLARVDFLLARESGALYVNEVNTLPGFTTISMYSKLWAASGLDYAGAARSADRARARASRGQAGPAHERHLN